MSAPIDLTAKVGPQQGWNLFSCCLPKSDAPMKEQDTSEIVEAESKVRDVGPELDLPELGDEPLPPQRARKVDESNLITAFWKLMISFVLFQFMGFKNDRKAIKSESEKTDVLLPGKKEEVREAE